MNLEEFRKALSSDATEENARLKKQLSDLQTDYHEKVSKLESENDLLKESCRVLCNRCFTLTRGVTCLFCGLDYQQAALRTAPGDLPPEKLLLNGLMGLNGEAGEAIDILKKHLFQGHELDTAHMAKELGDVAWYLAVSANAIGYDLETIMQMNVDKLKARYPDGFDTEHSLHRNQDDI